MLFEQAHVAEVLGVQRRKVLPVENVLPHTRNAGLDLTRVGCSQVQRRVDAEGIAIDLDERRGRGYVS
jgi:hypothetical protein